MILHVSVTADSPRDTAELLAELLGGIAIPVGPGKGSWSAVGPDPVGNVIEVLPRGSELRPSGDDTEAVAGGSVRHSGFHLLMESPLSEVEVMKAAERRGVTARRCSRGIFGDLIEIWIDECLLVEVLPLTWARAYRKLLSSDELRTHVAHQVAETEAHASAN